MSRARSLALAVAALWLTACGHDEAFSAVPPSSNDAGGTLDASQSDAGTDTGADVGVDTGVDAGAPLRTVETRPRFGDLDPTNLLLDGDFEYSAPDALTYPWFQFDGASWVTGAMCRTGLRCASLAPGGYIAGVYLWPPSGAVEASFHARVVGTDCSIVTGYLTTLDTGQSPPVARLTAETSTPDADGLCRYSQTADVPADTGRQFWVLLISVDDQATDGVLLDSAVIRAVGTTAQRRIGSVATGVPAIVTAARASFARRPPPPPVQETRTLRNPTGRRLR